MAGEGWGPRQAVRVEGVLGGEGNLCEVASQQQQQQQLFVTDSQALQRKKKKKKKKPIADPALVGRPDEVTSANAYTLNLWAADEDRTLTKRQRKRGTGKD